MTPEEARANAARRAAEARRAQGVRTPEMQQNRERALAGDLYMGPEQGFVTDRQASVTPATPPSQFDTAVRSGLQGSMLGYGDEITGALRSAITPGLSYGDAVQSERALLSAGESAYPKTATAAEIGGAFLTPAPAVTSVPKAVATGTAAGMTYASGKADDGDRLGAAVSALPESFLFSAGAVAAQRAVAGGVNALKNAQLPSTKARLARLQKVSGKLRAMAQRFEQSPTVANARRVRDAAYDAVDRSPFRFTKAQFDDLVSRVEADMASPNSGYVPKDTKAEAALDLLHKNQGRDMKLSELDNVRKRLMKRWVKADDAEAETIMSMVREIDGLIDGGGGGDAMRAAREAHKTYLRLDHLEKAFEKAASRSSVTYAGGNQYNNYAKVFEKILSDPKQARMFTPEMLDFMNKAIDAPLSERLQRKLGKLSPDGNGLMLALSVIGGSVEPSTLAAFGAGAGAKALSDRTMLRKADDMMRLAAGLPPVPVSATPGQISIGAAVAGQQD